MSDIATISSTETPLAGLSDELQKKILAYSERIASSSSITVPKIRNDAKSFVLPDGTETDSFVGIIVGIKHANIHYAGEYEEGKTNPPDCIAVMESEDAKCSDLSPHSVVMNKYSSECASCPKFQWGSDRGGKGKGKECAEYTLVAVYIPSLGDETLYLLECKKNNSKNVDTYILNASNRFGHPIAVTTKFIAGSPTKWSHAYETVGMASEDVLTNLAGRMDEANNLLVQRVLGAYTYNNDKTEEKSEESAASPKREARSRK